MSKRKEIIEIETDKEQEVTNFGRFYSAFQKLTIYGEREEMKRQFVLQYTAGRTESLKEMTRKEYTELCIAIERMNGTKEEMKRRRSIALKLMQEIGIATTDWAQINDFCKHPRIIGKAFGRLSIDELKGLATKLRTIKRKGWHRRKEEAKSEPKAEPKQQITYIIKLAGNGTKQNGKNN